MNATISGARATRVGRDLKSEPCSGQCRGADRLPGDDTDRAGGPAR